MHSLDPKYLQRLVETSPDIIVAVDIKGTVVYYNDGARRGLQLHRRRDNRPECGPALSVQ